MVSSRALAIVGENLVDLLVSPEGKVDAVVGGGPLNVARTIGGLGSPVHFFSGISHDAFGSLVRRSLLESDVEIALWRPLGQPTTLAVVELGPEGPRYSFHLHGTAAFCLDPDETAAAMARIAPLGALYAGTLALLVEPLASLAEALVMSASIDTLVVIDPNCRPSAVHDADQYHSRVARLCSRADVVKVSGDDLAYLFPDHAEHDGARKILEYGARCVIVTRGADPVTVLHDRFELTIDVAPTQVVDTVGAGDSLVGGFIVWWTGHGLARPDLDDPAAVRLALEAAVEISRLTCQRAGAQPPRVTDLEGSARWDWL